MSEIRSKSVVCSKKERENNPVIKGKQVRNVLHSMQDFLEDANDLEFAVAVL